ncbi:hypothetical protein RM553_05395 [Zunongwangia sp. F363]|uniref:Uncharacterized protein n=1 Tax=Autumnicola tepida TaxID=3075595 RepID=A0ABU3C7E4_9FLAO|nr:hypothetical protein [Zunongwangia sp. F363]MDT0642264.1 hypothetical protein [Zunongwangia sp. F363]
MKKLLLIVFLLFSLNAIQAQENYIKAGHVVTIEEPSTPNFRHIHFPRPNFIIKRGGIVNYKREYGQQVEILAIETRKDGTRQARLRRTDGKKFFRSQSTVLADIDEAIAAGEISL